MRKFFERPFVRETLFVLLFLLLAYGFFFKNAGFNHSFRMGDGLYWELAVPAEGLTYGETANWKDAYMDWSFGAPFVLRFSNLLLKIIPEAIFFQLDFIIALFMAGYGMFLYLRALKMKTLAAVFGAVAFMFANDYVTHILAGHTGTMETFPYIPFALLFIYRAVTRVSIIDFAFTGFILGMMFSHMQSDMSAYFAVFLSIYFLVLVVNKRGEGTFRAYAKTNRTTLVKLFGSFLLVPLLAASFGSLGIVQMTSQFGKDAEPQSFQEHWDFATRWSYPPSETPAFFAPNLFGTYSGSFTHPYWGGIGRIDRNGEPSTSNMSSVGAHMCIIVLFFAVMAVVFVRKRNQLFFGIMALALLLISFGRYIHPGYLEYFPSPYRIIDILFLGVFRNPNKFIHPLVVCIAILAAMGFNYFLNFLKAKENDALITSLTDADVTKMKWFNYGGYIFAGVTLLALLITVLGRGGIADALSAWNARYQGIESIYRQSMASVITDNVITSLFLSFLLTATLLSFTSLIFTMKSSVSVFEKVLPLIAFTVYLIVLIARDLVPFATRTEALLPYVSGFAESNAVGAAYTVLIFFSVIGGILALIYLAVILFSKTRPATYYKATPIALIALTVFSLWHSGQYFLVTEPLNKEHTPNQFISVLKSLGADNGGGKVFFVVPGGGSLNYDLTATYPAAGLRMLKAPAQRQIDANLAKVEQLFRQPNASGRALDGLMFHPLYFYLADVRYFVTDRPLETQFSEFLDLIAEKPMQGATNALYRLSSERAFGRPASEFFVVGDAVTVDSIDGFVARMQTGTINLAQTAIIESADGAPPFDAATLGGSASLSSFGKRIFSEKENPHTHRTYTVTANQNSIFIEKEYYEKNWNVYIDGEKAPMLKVNGLFRGVFLPEGTHTVVFRYENALVTALFWFTAALWVVFFALVGYAIARVVQEKKRDKTNA